MKLFTTERISSGLPKQQMCEYIPREATNPEEILHHLINV